MWQRLVDQYADTTSTDILGHPIEQVVGLLQDVNASEHADTQLDGMGKARGFSVVYDFSLATDKYSEKWKMIA